MIITKDLIGKKLTLTLKRTNGALEDIPCMIETWGNSDSLTLLSNKADFNAGHNVPNNEGFAFGWVFGSLGIALTRNIIQNFYSIKLSTDEILVKKDSSGFLFRRIYRKDGGIIFLGSVQKDPEAAKKPSAIISIYDFNFLKSKGWDLYKQEISAEEKASTAKKVFITT